MFFKFSPHLLVDQLEFERFRDSLDINGFRKKLLEESNSFGLIYNRITDPQFQNARVSRDVDSSGGKTIKVSAVQGIDIDGLFLSSNDIRSIPVPNTGSWYWVRIKHKYHSIEKGTFSIDAQGNLTGIGAELTSILRQGKIGTIIRFKNSSSNPLEYQVLQVIDDQHAVLKHPGLSSSGGLIVEGGIEGLVGGGTEGGIQVPGGTSSPSFVAESNLQLQIVGNFDFGIYPVRDDKFPYQYDGVAVELVAETVLNTKPNYTKDKQFYLARIKVTDTDIIIQDKRLDIWKNKGEADYDRIATKNPLIGVEGIRWQGQYGTNTENIVIVGWGMRSQNWSVDTQKNILTVFGSATGGKYKNIDSFTNGEFDGWRVYTSNGKYSRVVSSIKQGAAINLTLDVLDIDNYSGDGGNTINSSIWVNIVPDADTITLRGRSTGNEDKGIIIEKSFNISNLVGFFELPIFGSPTCKYIIDYKLTKGINSSGYSLIPSDEQIGYYTESSYNEDGTLKDENNISRKTYLAIPSQGFIELVQADGAYSTTIAFINKGDLVGVEERGALNESSYVLKVGKAKQYQRISGDITLTDDVYFQLDPAAKEGNEFIFLMSCKTYNSNAKAIRFIGTNGETVKVFSKEDGWCMLNRDSGLMIRFVYNGTNWRYSQNYEFGPPNELKQIDGQLNQLFGPDGMGIVKGLFGYHVCDGTGGTPDLSQRFLRGQNAQSPAGQASGSDTFTLTANQLPPHTHEVLDPGHSHMQRWGSGSGGADGNNGNLVDINISTSNEKTGITIKSTGNGDPITLVPKYYSIIYAKKMF